MFPLMGVRIPVVRYGVSVCGCDHVCVQSPIASQARHNIVDAVSRGRVSYLILP